MQSKRTDSFSTYVYRLALLIGFIIMLTFGASRLGFANTLNQETQPTATVVVAGLNVRSGPGVNYDRIAGVKRGDQLIILGQVDQCAWLRVRTPDNLEGFVSGLPQYVTMSVACVEIVPFKEQATTSPALAPFRAIVQSKIVQLWGEGTPRGADSYALVKNANDTFLVVFLAGGQVDTGLLAEDMQWAVVDQQQREYKPIAFGFPVETGAILIGSLVSGRIRPITKGAMPLLALIYVVPQTTTAFTLLSPDQQAYNLTLSTNWLPGRENLADNMQAVGDEEFLIAMPLEGEGWCATDLPACQTSAAAEPSLPPATPTEILPTPVPSPIVTKTPTSTKQPATATPSPSPTPLPARINEEEAWRQLKCMDTQSLQKFLTVYPVGDYARDVKLFLTLLEAVSDLQSGHKKPEFVIPFAAVGERWQEWQQRRPEKGAIGYVLRGDVLALSTEFPGCNVMSFDGYGAPITPTGNGSIVAFETNGSKFAYLNSIFITSERGSTLYFAVIDDVGLVHIHGQGKVLMPDGTEIELPSPTATSLNTPQPTTNPTRGDTAPHTPTPTATAVVENTNAYLQRGDELQAQGNYQAAIAEYDHAIQLNRNFAATYGKRGNAHFALGNLDAALDDYTKLIQLSPNDATAYYARGLTYAQHGDTETARADFDKAIQLNPEYVDAFNDRGIAYYNEGNLEAALADYSTAIRINPAFFHAYNNRGNIRLDQGDLEAALADYNEAIRLNPEYALGYRNRSLVYYELGKLDEAMVDLEQAIELDPAYVDAYNDRGNIFLDRGDLKAALADYDKAIRLNPNFYHAYRNRGLVHYREGDYSEALSYFDKALDLDPEFADAFYSRGVTYLAQNNLNIAAADFEQFLKLNPDNAGALNSVCWEYALSRQPKIALPYCQRAIAIAPEPYILDSRGVVFALMGAYDAAIKDITIYIAWLEQQDDAESAAQLNQRRAWIETLAQGKNPFTPALLEELRFPAPTVHVATNGNGADNISTMEPTPTPTVTPKPHATPTSTMTPTTIAPTLTPTLKSHPTAIPIDDLPTPAPTGNPVCLLDIVGSAGQPMAKLCITSDDVAFGAQQEIVRGSGFVEAEPGEFYHVVPIFQCGENYQQLSIGVSWLEWDVSGKTVSIRGLAPIVDSTSGDKYEIISDLENPTVDDGVLQITIKNKGDFSFIIQFDGSVFRARMQEDGCPFYKELP